MNTNGPSTNLADGAEIELGEDILGIRGPVDIPTGWEWLWWTLGALLTIALAYLLIRKLLSKIQFVRPPQIPYVPPHTLARRRLQDAMRLIGDPDRFCTMVSHAVREYIEGRFSIHAPDRTTDEFLEELRNDAALSPEQQERMAAFLIECDLVKFARNEPSEEQLRALHGTALGLVEETMPGVEEVGGAKQLEVEP